jgi:hypothetical protein
MRRWSTQSGMRIESDDFGGMFDVVWICCRVVEAFRNWETKVIYRFPFCDLLAFSWIAPLIIHLPLTYPNMTTRAGTMLSSLNNFEIAPLRHERNDGLEVR